MSVIFVIFNLLAMNQIGRVVNTIYQGGSGGLVLHTICAVIFSAITIWALKVSLKEKTTLPKMFGYIFFFVGLVLLTTVRGSEDWIYTLCSCLGLLGDGCLIMYNRKPEEKPAPVQQEAPKTAEEARPVVDQTVSEMDSMDDSSSSRLFKLFMRAENCPTAKKNPQFVQTLRESYTLYEELQKRDVKMSENLQDEMEKLLTDYLDLDDDTIQTERTAETIGKIEEGFGLIHEALHNMYDRQFQSQQFDIETDVKALEMQLRQEGLLDSDFVMKKSEEVEEDPED